MVATAASTPSYTYAGSDQRELISQVLPSGSTYGYAYGRTDRNDLPLLESISNPNGQSYLVHDDAGTPLALTSHTGNYVYYVLDGLGSPVGLVNSRGVLVSSYSYDPYGQVTEANLAGNSVTSLNPYRFAGGLADSTSKLVHFGQRWCDPATGRFTQQDSLETLADPSRANRYECAVSNPGNYVDPFGLAPCYYPCDPDPYDLGRYNGCLPGCYAPTNSWTWSPTRRQTCGFGAVVGAIVSFTPAGRVATAVGRVTAIGGLVCI